MTNKAVATLVLLLGITPAFCQEQTSATKQDVEQLLQITGTRASIQRTWTQMGQQLAMTAADSYHLRHPDATPMQVHKVSQIASKSFESSMAVLSVDEVIATVVPIYQQHLSHAEVRAIIDFYNSPPGQKYLKELPAMQADSMKAMEPIIKKHLPEMEAAADKAVQKAMYPSAVSSREGR
jgi:uncharacterized protein